MSFHGFNLYLIGKQLESLKCKKSQECTFIDNSKSGNKVVLVVLTEMSLDTQRYTGS